jgi:hypothetical protein
VIKFLGILGLLLLGLFSNRSVWVVAAALGGLSVRISLNFWVMVEVLIFSSCCWNWLVCWIEVI